MGNWLSAKIKNLDLKSTITKISGEWNTKLYRNDVWIMWLDVSGWVTLPHSMYAQVTTSQCSMTPQTITLPHSMYAQVTTSQCSMTSQTCPSVIPSKALKLLLSVVQKCCMNLDSSHIIKVKTWMSPEYYKLDTKLQPHYRLSIGAS